MFPVVVIITRLMSAVLKAEDILEKWVENTSVLRTPRVGPLEVMEDVLLESESPVSLLI